MSLAAVPTPAPVVPDWLPLLRELTLTVPRWAATKNTDSAIAGNGDIDSAAPRADWPDVQLLFAAWAADAGAAPVIACRHVPRTLLLLALDREQGRALELDVTELQPLRGSTLFTPERLAPLLVVDERGFRRLRPGAEGLVLLLLNGLRAGGRANERALVARDVAGLLRNDPEGVRAAAGALGTARGPSLALAAAVERGGWDRRAALAIDLHAAVRSLASPRRLAERTRFRRELRRCPVLELVFRHRRELPADVDAWLARASAGHEVIHA